MDGHPDGVVLRPTKTLEEIKAEIVDLLGRLDGCRDGQCSEHGGMIERIDTLGVMAQTAESRVD